MYNFFVPDSSPPAHNLSVMTHTLSGFDLDSICFLSQSDPSSSVTHRSRSVGLEQNIYLYSGERRGRCIDSSLKVSPCLISLGASIWLSCKMLSLYLLVIRLGLTWRNLSFLRCVDPQIRFGLRVLPLTTHFWVFKRNVLSLLLI